MNIVGRIEPYEERSGYKKIVVILIVFLLYDKYFYDLSIKSLPLDSTLIIPIILLITFFVQHELVHYITTKILGYNSKIKLTSIRIEESIRLDHFRIIVIAPLIILSTVYGALLIFIKDFSVIWLLVLILNILGSKGDINQFKSSLSYSKKYYVKGDDKGHINVYSNR